MREGYVQTDPGVKIHYVEYGDPQNQTIVFIHGFPEYSFAWRDYLEPISEKGYHCVAIDMRGYHKSSKPQGIKHYQMDRLTDDVKEVVKHFGGKAVIIGHDWGGAVTWEFGYRYPEYCDGIIVMNCPHRPGYAKNVRENLALNLRQQRKSWYIYLFQLPWIPELIMKAKNFKWFEKWGPRKIKNEDMKKYKENLGLPYGLTGPINFYRANLFGEYGMGIIKKSNWKTIPCPTLLLWGEKDMALDVGLTKNMDEFFTGDFKVKYYPDASHWIHLDKTEEVKADILAFLNNIN
jgi:pimeloyl-ACP methyl ester carboxylesterase